MLLFSFQERINLFLTHCSDDDVIKLNKVIDIYTLKTKYLNEVKRIHGRMEKNLSIVILNPTFFYVIISVLLYFSSFQSPLAVRLGVMMSAAYGIQLVFKRIPHTLAQRHHPTRGRQCLCQFVEEFLSAFLSCIRRETDMSNMSYLLDKYLNIQFKSDKALLQALDINTVINV